MLFTVSQRYLAGVWFCVDVTVSVLGYPTYPMAMSRAPKAFILLGYNIA